MSYIHVQTDNRQTAGMPKHCTHRRQQSVAEKSKANDDIAPGLQNSKAEVYGF